MSNPSLKEQLQALSLDLPKKTQGKKTANKKTPIESKSQKKQFSNQKQSKSSPQKPAWLEYVQYGVQLLKTHYPACFKDAKNIQPLKVGIKQDLTKSLSGREDITIPDKACMINSLSYYVNSTSYHKSVVAGNGRIDLNGELAGQVTAEEAAYSLERWQAKMKKRKANQPAVVQETVSSPIENQ